MGDTMNNNQDLNSLYGNQPSVPNQNNQPNAPTNTNQNINDLYGNQVQQPIQQQPVIQPQEQINNQIPNQQVQEQPVVNQPVQQPEVPIQNSQPQQEPVQPRINPHPELGPIPGQTPPGDNTNPVDDEYVQAFVGPNYQDFVQSQFNIGAFFLAQIYFFYRKMFLYGLAIYAVELTILMLTGKVYIGLIVSLGFGFLTNKIYLSFARNKVNKLKQKYQGGDLKMMCEKKGGTSVGFAILGVVIEVITAIIALFIMIFIVGVAILGSSLVNGGIDQNRTPAMVSTLKQYPNGLKISIATENVTCNNKNIINLSDGNYYVEIDTSDGNSIAQKNSKVLVPQGGKSPWNSADMKGYIKVVKTNNNYQYYINMSDNTHGTKQEVSSDNISQNDISNNASFPTTPNGIKCSVTE